MANTTWENHELIKTLSENLELIADATCCESKYGFSIEDYMKNRKDFAEKCKNLELHIRNSVKNTGIAKVTGGSVGIASGSCVLLGVILSPFTFGASLGLTIAGVTGGIASAATTIGSSVAQTAIIVKAKNELKEFLMQFEAQELVVTKLLENIHDGINKVKALESGTQFCTLDDQIYNLTVKSISLVNSFAWNGVELGKTIYQTVNFVGEAAEAGAAIPVRAVAAAMTSTAAKVCSGIFAGVGIGINIYDICDGAQDINSSKCADAFEEFVNQYEMNTEIMVTNIENYLSFYELHGFVLSKTVEELIIGQEEFF